VEAKTTGTAVRQLPEKEIGTMIIPLPPLAEQHRIVAKIEELLPYCDRLVKK
jgi:type I restriction enzyme S subunit